MQERYDVQFGEARSQELWKQSDVFRAPITPRQRPFSMFLVPPNASGPMHIGNAFMVALQDVAARYHRARGDSTLWIPGTDHGGYETQITFEKELEQHGVSKDAYSSGELYAKIADFVDTNNQLISRQIERLGASVDWSQFRFTLDDRGQSSVAQLFKKMLSDNLVYRKSYMVNYCPHCATVLADIELKELLTEGSEHKVHFYFRDGDGSVVLRVTRPEFLFTVTHVLVHPDDSIHAHLIGEVLENPVTGEDVYIVASKRKYVADTASQTLTPFMPACVRFDYEYAIRNNLPAHDVVDWDGTMKGQYQSKRPDEVRAEVIALLYTKGYIEGEGVPSSESVFVCKKGHTVCTIIRQTWFVRLDDERVSLRKNAVAAIHREQLKVFPRWREKGLVDWINKMHDWPIARQNAWGIRIPLWYEVTRPEDFLVWLRDDAGMRHHGSLATFLAQGRTIADIIPQLERVYAPEDCVWTHEPEAGKEYLPEMDMFDTWFSSGAWGTTVFGSSDITTLSPWYPSAMMVIGHDLLRLSVARKILLSTYMNGTLPFRSVYFHRLILASDGQKMSKSLGNAVPLDQYLSEYGADVTRMALVSYADEAEDFVFETEKLEFYAEFIQRAWRVARIYDTARTHGVDVRANVRGTEGDQLFMTSLDQLVRSVAHDLDKMLVTKAQERVVGQLEKFEVYTTNMLERGDIEVAASVFCATFEKYLRVLHPFAPHFTEEVWCAWDASPSPLAQEPWPTTSLVPRSH